MSTTNDAVWVDIPDYPGYRATEDGHIIGTRFNRPLKTRVSRDRLIVTLVVDGVHKTVAVHKAILLAFVGPRPESNTDIRHLDGDFTNNRLSNLRYGTRQENEADKLAHGTSNRGTRNGQAKLTEESVRLLWSLHAEGLSNRKIAARLGVSHKQVGRILHGLDWAWLNV